MPSRTYFLDASALTYKYAAPNDTDSNRVKLRVNELFAVVAKSNGKLSLQVPNICMAECAKSFAKACFQFEQYGDGERAVTAYRRLRDVLLSDVSRERILHSYELKRIHFADIEEIFLDDHRMPPPRGLGDYLSSHDALIISMATEYGRRIHGSARAVTIVTCDRRIAEFSARHAEEFAAAVCVLDRDVV